MRVPFRMSFHAVLLAPVIASAAPSVPVQVVNAPDRPVPVAVQGAVTGTVSIAGTPSVAVQGVTPVAVTNTTATPAGVRSADEPGRGARPFHVQVFGVPYDCSSSPPLAALTVPAGSVLVLEFVTVAGRGGTGAFVSGAVITTVAGVTASHQLGTVITGTPVTSPNATTPFVMTQPLRLYADPGTEVKLAGCIFGLIDVPVATVTLSGYLLELP